jgi:hypothetical protein
MLKLLDRLREALTYAEFRGLDLHGLEITISATRRFAMHFRFGIRFSPKQEKLRPMVSTWM